MTKEFNVGDEVCVEWRGFYYPPTTVTKRYKTGHVIIASDPDARWRQNGTKTNSTGYRHSFLVHYDDEVREKLREQNEYSDAERVCADLAEMLLKSRGRDAVRLAKLISPELRKEAGI